MASTETPAAAAISAALVATLPAAASAPAAAKELAAAPAAVPADKPAVDEAEGEEPLPEPKTPEEKEVRGLLVDVGKVEYSHGAPGDKVKINESRMVMEGLVMYEKARLSIS